MHFGAFKLPTALLALPFGIAATAALLYGTDHLVYRFYRRQRVPSVMLMIVSTGVMFIMNGIVRFCTSSVANSTFWAMCQ